VKKYSATGVAFKTAGKIYDFLTNGINSKRGDFVVVETEKGEDIATVIKPDREIEVDDSQIMKKILRVANEQDLNHMKKNKEDEPKAFLECKKLIKEHQLEMKLLKAEYTLDRTKITFYFTADGRIDFRQLVRDLARIFRTRIEMRQVGVRDATKMLGGFGVCGKEFCCSPYLRQFDNISIKMAKDQNLILNPGKISGVCGRLMCCLMFEKDIYEEEVENAEEVIVLQDDSNDAGGVI
jgi:cell fate regulator YaaT (PSP1 superfamily)